jgi:hypothetical protein
MTSENAIMKTLFRGALTRRSVLACLFAALSGCGTTPAPAPADEDQARKTLDQALTGWQKGETVDGMKKASPSILVSDPKWSQGVALKKFEVKGGGKPAGAERVFAVTLWLTDSKGKEATESVDYKVGTSPILTVFRSLF